MDAEFQEALRNKDFLRVARLYHRMSEIPLAFKYALQVFANQGGHMRCFGNWPQCPGEVIASSLVEGPIRRRPCVPESAKPAHQLMNQLNWDHLDWEPRHAAANPPISFFIQEYIRTAIFYETAAPSADTFFGLGLTVGNLTEHAMQRMTFDCNNFIKANWDDLHACEARMGTPGWTYSMGEAGHDFWLTRNHYGTGFWDRFLDEIGDRLTISAEAFGETSLILVGDSYDPNEALIDIRD